MLFPCKKMLKNVVVKLMQSMISLFLKSNVLRKTIKEKQEVAKDSAVINLEQKVKKC